jgi:secondary thiamine-phosphate synthase enzyme
MEDMQISTKNKMEIIDITEAVSAIAGRKAGRACLVFSMHTTAGLMINENEPNIMQDYVSFFHALVPKGAYLHNKLDNNAESHLLCSQLRPFLVIPMENGNLVLGIYQRLLFVETDGPRERKIVVQVLQ